MNKIHTELVALCSELELPLYQRILLIEMLYRKVRHPEEDVNQLIDKAVDEVVPKRYKALKKRSCIRVSVNKEKRRLEEELHDCRNLPEQLLTGDVIENTIRYYYNVICGLE